MDQDFNPQAIKDIFVLDSENIYETQIVQKCFDIIGVFVAALDLNGNITLINRKGREILGFSEDEIVGANLLERFVARGERNRTKELLTAIMKGKSTLNENTRYYLQTIEKKTRIIESKNITIRDKNHNILGVLISGEDITDYLKNQTSLQKDINLYRILANNIPDINLYFFDKDLRFILAEGGEMKNNGFTRDSFEGKTLSEISSDHTKQIWEPLFVSAIQGKTSSTEYQFNNYYYLIWVLPIKDDRNQVYSGIAITQNITDDKITEQKLKKSKEEAEKANRAKSDFLARVSHEIRTPLNAILGFTEQLKQTKLNKKQNNYLEVIDKSSEHLLSLINDILVLSKIEALQINFDNSPFKIENVVKYVTNVLMAKADEKNLQFSYSIDKKLDKILLGDSFRLRQILLNFLSNAIKFTHSGYIELRCILTNETQDRVITRFDIIDTGIGIRPESLETIFEQFNQASSDISKKYGGTGLGLTICKNLIELQNGKLSVSSQVNIGTTFTFSIPYQIGNMEYIHSDDLDSIDTEKLRNKKVLLIDDDSVNRILGKTILKKFNCSFDIAKNGNEAIAKLNKQNYDIVLLDIRMPDISGVEVANYIRLKKKDKKTKIIAVTAAVMKDDIMRYYQAGINDFLVKPFKEVYLFNKMCEVLKIKNHSVEKSIEEIILKEELSPKNYNLKELKKMTGNNKAVMAKMLITFIENSLDAIMSFQQALKNENWEQIGETAHKILPSFRHLEVFNISSDLMELKTKTLLQPQYKQVPALVEKVIEETNHVIDDLKKEVNQYTNKI